MPSIYERVVKAAELAITALQNDKVSVINGTKIRDWVKGHSTSFPDENVDELLLSWPTYMTRALADPNTRVAREPGKYSYTLKDKAIQSNINKISEPDTATMLTDTVGNNRQLREKKLYALLSEWLKSKEYNAVITASTRSGGKWGNPDVTGIMVIDNPLGGQSMETCTIEAKISLSSEWKREIFEAVSHKRFSNRAYYAFAVGSDMPSLKDFQDYDELRRYGSKYRIGIIAVSIPTEQYKTLTEDNLEDFSISLDEIDVLEIWPADFEMVHHADLNNFVRDVLELKTATKVQRFGLENL